MTQPPTGGPAGPGQPQQPDGSRWAQQPPGYGPPPVYGQPGYGQPASDARDGQWEILGDPRPEKPRPRGRLIASAAVVVALVGGGAATYIAVSDSSTAGAATPREAIQKIVDDLNKSDLIGVLDDLAPAERAALADPARDSVDQLKRLKMLQGSADPESVTGLTFHATGLTFADQTVTVNDRVQIVQLTGGTVTTGSDLSKVPFTKEFLKAAFPDGTPTATAPRTTDIAAAARDNGGPFRLAAQKVDGRWYPSIFYTVADNAAHDAGVEVTPADAIPARGAASPEAAVEQVVRALFAGDLETVLRLMSPDEMAAVHDYGKPILDNLGSHHSSRVTVTDVKLTSTEISGGGRRVTLSSLTLDSPSNGELRLVRDGGCVSATDNGDTKRLCATDLADQVVSFLNGVGATSNVTPAQRAALAHLITGATNVGLDVSRTDGEWYVTPARSVLDLVTSSLSALRGDDLLEIVELLNPRGR